MSVFVNGGILRLSVSGVPDPLPVDRIYQATGNGPVIIGTTAPASAHGLVSASDLLVKSKLEVQGALFVDGNVTFTLNNVTLTDGCIHVDTIQDVGNYLKRNQAVTTTPLLTLENTNTNDDYPVLVVNQKATGAIDAVRLNYDGTGYSLLITPTAASAKGIKWAAATNATKAALEIAAGAWLGTASEGLIDIRTAAAATIPAGRLVHLSQLGTGQHAAQILGSALYIQELANSPAAGDPSIAAYINTTKTVGLYVDKSTGVETDAAVFAQAGTSAAVRMHGPTASPLHTKMTLAHGQSVNIKSKMVQHTLALANTSVEAGFIPAGCHILSMSVHPTTAVTTSAATNTYNIGDGTDVDKFGSAIASAANATIANWTVANWTAGNQLLYAAATNLVLTAPGVETFTAGVVRITITYIDCVAATS